MAHECPDCGMVCRCGGDIDDCILNSEEDVVKCNHYLQCGGDDDMSDYPPYDDEDC